MENTQTEAVLQKTGGKRVAPGGRKSKAPAVIAAVLAVLLAAYLGLCAYASNSSAIFPGVTVYGQDVGGLTVSQAERVLSGGLQPGDDTPIRELLITQSDSDQPVSPESDGPVGDVTFGDLGGVTVDGAASAQKAYDYCHGVGFLRTGWRFVRSLLGQGTLDPVLTAPHLAERIDSLAERLSLAPVDAAYTLSDNAVSITVAKDGYSVAAADLKDAIETALRDCAYTTVQCPGTPKSAQTLTAQEIYDAVAGEMKNAGYDSVADAITPEQLGADFDVSAAQTAMDGAAPGETVEVPASIEYPAVTAQQLEKVLFRDVLGETRTHVSGTAARISNVKLSAASINNVVLNCGDVFSYNDTVGQRTAARGYQAAPAYVQGQTVDEIGGGICQTSSTLYLACLRSDLEITERYAHRYTPAYIPWGLDATVSWGGPDYRFTNNTDYPIKIVTSYSGGYLTVKILGTNADGRSVKMTTETLSQTAWETVYKEDDTLAPGTEKVDVTPYGGALVKSYRNVYDKDGKLLSSTFEASSDYKVRNQVILQGPALPDVPTADPDAGSTASDGADTGTADTGTVDSGTADAGAAAETAGTTGTETSGTVFVTPEPAMAP